MCHETWNLFHVGDAMSKLGDRFGDNDLIVEALQTICLGIPKWWTGGNAENGTSVSEGRGEARQAV